jgi:lipopolysaccharide export system permease protein
VVHTLHRHILMRVLAATALVLATLVLMGWFTQVVTLLDFVVVNGRSLLEFLGVTVLLVPLIVALIMPTALFVATIFVLDRMSADSELAVIGSAGISRWGLLRPFLVACAAAVVVALVSSLLLQPMAMAELRKKKSEIRADVMATLIDEGQFSAPRHGLMIHVKGKAPDGDLTGIIFEDSRNADRPVTYLASRARLVTVGAQVFLLLTDGSVVRGHVDHPTVELVHFEQYSLDLSGFFEDTSTERLRAGEMYLGELFNPPADRAFAPADPLGMRAEAHNRLSNPFYCLAAVIIAFAALARPRTSRSSRVWAIVAATVLASAVRIGGIVLVSAAGRSGAFVVPLYALPVAASITALAFMVMRDGGFARVPAGIGVDMPGSRRGVIAGRP